jgi:hypothetical protein
MIRAQQKAQKMVVGEADLRQARASRKAAIKAIRVRTVAAMDSLHMKWETAKKVHNKSASFREKTRTRLSK